jgi:N-acetylneuraminic acid mutarotase
VGLALARLLLVGAAIGATAGSASASVANDWTMTSGVLAVPHWFHASASDGAGNLYIFGGLSGKWFGSVTRAAETRDSGGVWSSIRSLPAGRAQVAAAFGSDGMIHIFGGFISRGVITTTHWVYNPATNLYSNGPAMPAARCGESVVEGADGRIYVIGGSPPGKNLAMARVDRYDPATQTWTRMADLPAARADGAASLGADGDIYYFGGVNARGDTTTSVFRFDPVANHWTTLATKTPATGDFWAATTDHGMIYLVGGETAKGLGVTTVKSFDPSSQTWTCVDPLPVPRDSFTADSIGGTIVAVGGTATFNHPTRSEETLPLGASDTEPPRVVTPPGPAFVNHATVATTAIPIVVRWHACDNWSVIDSYALDLSTNGGPPAPVALGSPVDTSIMQTPAPGATTYGYQVTATDHASNATLGVGPTFTVTLRGDSAANYSRGWHIGNSVNDLGGHVHYTTTVGASARVTLTSRDVALVAPRRPTSGTAAVYLGRKLLGKVKLHSSTTLFRQVVFTHHFPSNASRTLRIVCRSGRIDIDAFTLLSY